MKTWHIETLVVTLVLLVVNIIFHHLTFVELLGSVAVLLSFGHASIADRLAEMEALKTTPQVECYRKIQYYFIGKEMCWLLYFFLCHAYSALVGVFVFLLYPVWRRLYRQRFPVGRHG